LNTPSTIEMILFEPFCLTQVSISLLFEGVNFISNILSIQASISGALASAEGLL
jgi:hypothetical protein